MTLLARTIVVCAAAVATSGIIGLAWVASNAAAVEAAQDEGRAAVIRAVQVRQRLARLPVSPTGAPQPDRIATLARSLLVAAGVGQEALAGIQPLGDSQLPGGAWHRQQVLLQLRGLSTAQVVAVVDAVARTDPAWAVGSVQIVHGGTGDRYDAGLSLTTLYPAQP